MRARTRHKRTIDVGQQLRWIGQTLREARERRGMTLSEAATASGLPERTIIRAEAGANVHLDTLIRLAWGLGVRLEVVPGPPAPIKVLQRPVAAPSGVLFWRMFVSLCEDRGITLGEPVSRRQQPRRAAEGEEVAQELRLRKLRNLWRSVKRRVARSRKDRS